MSNLTPEDVDLRLTTTKAELVEVDQLLGLELEDERISRIAGDEANKSFTELVQQQNSGTESRLSTEVIHRAEGDVSNLNSLNAIAQALSDYRIKTDIEIANEVIARKALGVELNGTLSNFVATWDHQQYLIYQAIQDVQSDVDGKYTTMDARIKKYEYMLQDITTDSIQITMDNGEINMGVWTILSQAREWDLQIIADLANYKGKTTDDLNQALEDIQNKLPVEQDIIDKAIEALSNAPIIKELDEKLAGNIADIDSVHQGLLKEITDRQIDMIAQAQNTANELQRQSDELNATVTAEANARIEALQREAAIREEQLRQEALERSEEIDAKIQETNTEVDDLLNQIAAEEAARIAAINQLNDGLTAEIEHRINGDVVVTTALENYKSSNDTALANVRTELNANVTATSANATKIDSLDVRLTTNESETATAKSLAASATQKAETALSETAALATQLTTVNASIDGIQNELVNKADAAAFNQLKAEVTTLDGKVVTNTQDLTALKTSVTGLDNTVVGHTSAINQLETKQTTQGGQITQLSQDTTILQNSVADLQEDMSTKVESAAFNQLSTKVDKNANDITAQSSELTRLDNSITVLTGKVDTKVDAQAFNILSAEVSNIDGRVVSNTNSITTLNGKIASVEGELATKLDANVISAYSTTVQMNSAIAEGITTYDANLEIGGENLYLGANPITLSGRAGELNVVTDAVSVSQLFKYLTVDELDMTQLAAGTNTVSSMEFYIPASTNNNFEFRFAVYRFSGTQYVQTEILKASQFPRDKWFRIALDEGVLPATAVAASNINISLYVYRRYIGDTIKWRNLMMEKGTKASAYSEPTSVLKKDIKANANAVQTVSAKVDLIDGRVTSNSSALTTLTNRVTTVESDVSKKADSTAVNALTSRVETAEGNITSQGNAVTKLQNDLVVTTETANGALPKITSTSSNFKQFRNVLNYYRGAAVTTNLVIETPITFSAKMTDITIKGYMYRSVDTSLDLRLGFYAYNTATPYLNRSVTNNGSHPVTVRLGVKDSKVVIILSSNTGNFPYPQFSIDASFAYTLAPDSWANGWSCVEVAEADLVSQGITNIQTPPLYDAKTSIEANATALQTLDNKVTQNGSDIASISTAQTSLTNRVTTVENGLTNKADSSAVQQLDSRVTTAEGKITTNATAITNLQNRVTTAENGLTATNSAVSGLTTRVTTAEGKIENLAIQSTQLKADLSSGGAVNLGVAAFTEPQTLIQMFNGGHTPSLIPSELRTNGKAYNIRNASSGAGNYIYMGVFNDNSQWRNAPLRVRTGKRYLVSAFMKADQQPAQVSMQMRVFAGDGVTAGSLTGALVTTGAPTNYASLTDKLVKYTWVIPTIGLANAQTGTLLFRGNLLGTTPVNTNIVIDNIMFEELVGDPVEGSPYVPGSADLFGIDTAIKANATALTETRAEVTRIDGVVKTQATAITVLQTDLAGKANTSAVTSLDTRVTAAEGSITALSNQTTSLAARLTTAEGNISATSNTVSTLNNKVTEIDGKVTAQGTAITKVESDLITLSGDVADKAEASALTALDTKVTNIDGRVNVQASSITQLQTDVSGNSAKLLIQGEVVDGLKASYVVKTDVNGLVSSYGLYNDNGVGAFGVNADYFYVGKGTTATNGKKPFMVLTSPQTIGGVTYPAGTWIDVALIANATIGTAHIADASITNAKINSLDAAKITTGTLDAARIKVGAATQYEIGYDPITKARTFVAQPVTPYRVGDIWKNGNSTAICISTRLTGSYVAADWGKTGDVTSENTAADTAKLGGVAAATVNQNISNADTKAGNAATAAATADNKAVAAQSTANTANNQVNAWKFTGTTEIDGGKIRADTVTATQINVAELSAVSANIGTLTSTSVDGTMTLNSLYFQVKDGNGQERIFLGVR